jgi:hypothetical protein
VIEICQDYCRRFSESRSFSSPYGHDCDTNDLKFYVPNRVSIERRAAESYAGPARDSTSDAEKGNPERNQSQSSEKCQKGDDIPPEPARTPPPRHGVSVVASTSTIENMGPHRSELPFKEECMRIVATFLRSDSLKELSLDAVVRETIIRDLRTSTHPDVVSYV